LFGSEIHFLRQNVIEKLFLRVFGSWHTGARIRAFHILRLALRYINGDFRILDAGCGLGRHAFFIARRCPKSTIVAVDMDGKNISICDCIKGEKGFANVRFEVRDLRRLDLNGHFDLIICSDVLEYIKEDETVLANLRSALAENGRLILHTPRLNSKRCLCFLERYFTCDPMEKAAHAREGYPEAELKDKVETSGLKVTSFRYTFGHLGSLAWELSRALERVRPLFVFCFPLILLLGYMDSLGLNKEGSGILMEAQRS
jgi:2-polyprenyl-3-methyl-5-hydroxy-6-metoxy-1,4-benzoquinol methylase